MAEHKHTPRRSDLHPAASTGRRSLLSAAPAVMVLSGAGIGTSVAAHALQPDAELIAHCGVIVANHAELNRYSDEFDGNDPPHVEARIRVLVDESHRLSEQVADMPAATMDGTKAKARAMLTYMGETSDGDLLWSNHDELLAWSIARDLLGEA